MTFIEPPRLGDPTGRVGDAGPSRPRHHQTPGSGPAVRADPDDRSTYNAARVWMDRAHSSEHRQGNGFRARVEDPGISRRGDAGPGWGRARGEGPEGWARRWVGPIGGGTGRRR